jgi:phosphoglycerate dehydrogenase-like enzyme
MTKVLIPTKFSDPLVQKIVDVSSQISVEKRKIEDREWPRDLNTDAEIVYAMNAVPDHSQAPDLRWIQVHSAGVNHLIDKPLWDSDIKITTTSGIHAPNMGQYVMAQILSFANRVNRWGDYQRQHEWPKGRWELFLPDELRGKTLGILGYGSLGREIARLARGFGMTILATKRDAKSIVDHGYAIPGTGDPEGMIADRIYPSEATRWVVTESDYIVVTLPLTPKTHHLLDEDLLKAMKPNCFLVNVGRGELINEAALIRALDNEWIAGAGLDVFEEEPLPSDSPLWSMPNVIISPHISGFTPHYDDRAIDVFVENLRRYLNYEPLINLVDRDSGY